jgi:hypothetical protein
MKRNSSFSIFFLAIFLMSLSNSMASTFNSSSVSNEKNKIVIIIDRSATDDLQQPSEPVSKPEEPSKKPHLLKTEELAHIHHFHKERVKKLKRHHEKFWMLSKIILVLCHLGLLVCAFLHLVNA